MKQIKILALVLALVTLFTFAACAKQETPAATGAPAETTVTAETAAPEETAAEEVATVLVAAADGTKTVEMKLADLAEGATLADALKADAYKDEFGAEFSEDGSMINALAGLVPETANNEFICIYTTDTTTEGVVDVSSEWTTKVDVDGVTFYSANVGVGALTLVAGESYLFQIATW